MTMPIAAGNEYVEGPGSTYGIDPSKLKFTNLTPGDIGLSSFEEVNQIPKLGTSDFDAVAQQLAQLDAAKAAGDPNYQADLARFKAFYQSMIRTGAEYVPPPTEQAAATQTQQATGEGVAAVPPPTAATTTATGEGVAAVAPVAGAQPVTTAATGEGVAAVAPVVAAETTAAPVTAATTPEDDINRQMIELLGPNATPFLAELDQMQEDYLRKNLNAPDFGPQDQATIDAATKAAETAQMETRRTIEKEASAAGLRQSTTVGRRFAEESGKLTQQLLDLNVSVRTAATTRGAAQRQAAFDRVAGFRDAIATRNVPLAQLLLEKYKADQSTSLSEKQLALQQQQIDATIALDRDKFTEEQRASLVAEGFTKEQIDNAQEQLLWERTYKTTQQSADIALANKNYDLQAKLVGGQLSIAERQQALSELKNNQDQTLAQAIQAWKEKMDQAGIASDQRDYDQAVKQFEMQFGLDLNTFALTAELQRGSLALQTLTADRENALRTRAADLAEQLGLRGADLDEAKLSQLKDQVQKEFGVQISDQELRREIANGQLGLSKDQLALDSLNSQRKYDLDVTAQKNQWLESQQSLDLQRELGIAELDLRRYLGDQQVSVEEDKMLLEKYMFEAGLAWDKEKFQKQLDEAKRKNKGSFFGKLIKTLVGAGAAVAGVITANPVLIAAGVNSVLGTNVATPAATS